MSDGFLLIDKPGGWTSHDVVAKVRSLSGERVGHAGTLDPMATGLLVLGLGRATRLLRFVSDADKSYTARVVFGVATETLDAEGAILTREPMDFSLDDLRGVAARFVGTISQLPPMVSAVRVDGKRLYEYAREGLDVARESRLVRVYRVDVTDFSPGAYPEAVLTVECSSGTYIRTLADDMAIALGGRSHLSRLRRARIGTLDVSEALGIEQVERAAAKGRIETLVLPPTAGLRDLPAVEVGSQLSIGVSNGMPFPRSVMPGPSPDEPFRVVDQKGRLLAVYRSGAHHSVPEVVIG